MKLHFFLLIIALFVGQSAWAQASKEEIQIQTSAECDMCKERIEKELIFTPGVKSAELNLETKVVAITYKSSKITPEELRQVIASVGYDADEVKAQTEAYESLPACCQKGGHDR